MATDKAITYLKNKAPKGEFLAYINKKEAAMLKKASFFKHSCFFFIYVS